MRIIRPKGFDREHNYDLDTVIVLETKQDVYDYIYEKSLSLSEAKDLVREFKDKDEVRV